MRKLLLLHEKPGRDMEGALLKGVLPPQGEGEDEVLMVL